MADFVYDNGTLNAAKVNRNELPSGEDPNKWVQAEDWNPAMQASYDLRGAILNNRFLGLQQLAVEPSVPVDGAADFLWLQDDGSLWAKINGVSHNLLAGGVSTLAAVYAAGLLPSDQVLVMDVSLPVVMQLDSLAGNVNPGLALDNTTTPAVMNDPENSPAVTFHHMVRGEIVFNDYYAIYASQTGFVVAHSASGDADEYSPVWQVGGSGKQYWYAGAYVIPDNAISIGDATHRISDLYLYRWRAAVAIYGDGGVPPTFEDGGAIFSDGSGLAASAAGTGELRYNNTKKLFEYSADTGDYQTLSAGWDAASTFVNAAFGTIAGVNAVTTVPWPTGANTLSIRITSSWYYNDGVDRTGATMSVQQYRKTAGTWAAVGSAGAFFNSSNAWGGQVHNGVQSAVNGSQQLELQFNGGSITTIALKIQWEIQVIN